ncbi:glycosyltransferase [Paenibacillus sp. 32352]|uniref:glycosyltransferase family protein n=1 Tax=Paenibacillus sp. 32352 TaxID=1969111 RepID=UPI0009AD615C|nr:glycosyltransferase [Paenibacillus sp. 32352]
MRRRLARSTRKKSAVPTVSMGTIKGRREGFRTGWRRGYHLGRSEAILQAIQAAQGIQLIRDLHVLFVIEAYEGGQFHEPINQGIIGGLQAQVRQVSVAAPMDNIVEVAKQVQPDLVFVLNGIFDLPIEHIDAIRMMGIRTCVWIAEDPYFIDVTLQKAPHFDYVFTHELGAVPYYQTVGCQQVHYLPLAVNEAMFRPQHVNLSYSKDICFIGTAFWNRVHFIDKVSTYLANKKTFISGFLWDRLKSYRRLRSKISLERCMSIQDTAAYYNASKIVINLHRSHEDDQHNYNSQRIPALSINPRTFDICACGALQLTDIRHDLSYFYTPGQEIVTYSSPEELKEKCDYYLKHEEERREIALRALRKTMSEHTYKQRISRLLSVIYG